MSKGIMKLPELIAAAADPRVTPRFVRFLIAEGLISSPSGGRTYATYNAAHLSGIRRYLRLRDMGLSISAIKALAAGEAPEAVAVDLATGLTLIIRPAELAGRLNPQRIATRIADALEDLAVLPTTSTKDE
jgi:DNA-binding transcriptional MerR regulator